MEFVKSEIVKLKDFAGVIESGLMQSQRRQDYERQDTIGTLDSLITAEDISLYGRGQRGEVHHLRTFDGPGDDLPLQSSLYLPGERMRWNVGCSLPLRRLQEAVRQ